MIKFKTSKKAIKEKYNIIVKVGYCDLQYLLQYSNPIAYSTRSEGWSCDYYDIEGILFSTGYSPLDNKNVKCNYETIKKYEAIAKNNTFSNVRYEVRKEINTKLISQFINEIIEGDN